MRALVVLKKTTNFRGHAKKIKYYAENVKYHALVFLFPRLGNKITRVGNKITRRGNNIGSNLLIKIDKLRRKILYHSAWDTFTGL